MRRALFREVLEAVLGELTPRLRALVSDAFPDLARPVRLAVERLRRDFLSVAGAAEPRFIRSPSGMLHATAAPGLTVCGWRWQRCPGAVPALETLGAEAVSCRSCMRTNSS